MTVTVIKDKDVKSAIKKLFIDIDFKPGKRVCIKPNWCGRHPVVPGENTSPVVLSALVEYLIREGCEVSLIHGALLGTSRESVPFDDTLKWAGIFGNKAFERVKVVNLDTLIKTKISHHDFTFHLPVDYFTKEMDTYINLAKIKSHMETTISFSLKNQMGLASQEDWVNMHRTDLEKGIARLALFMKPDVSILEGYPAMHGNGPHHGKPIPLNMLLAGDNMVELDSLACHLLGYDPENVRHISYAREIGAGNFINEATIKRYAGFSVTRFKKADKIYRFGRKMHAYPTKSCSRCINAVWQAGKIFKNTL